MCEIVYLYACHVYNHTVITKMICEMSLRYDGHKDTLCAASALDPCFKALPSLSAREHDDTSSRRQTELPLLHLMEVFRKKLFIFLI